MKYVLLLAVVLVLPGCQMDKAQMIRTGVRMGVALGDIYLDETKAQATSAKLVVDVNAEQGETQAVKAESFSWLSLLLGGFGL